MLRTAPQHQQTKAAQYYVSHDEQPQPEFKKWSLTIIQLQVNENRQHQQDKTDPTLLGEGRLSVCIGTNGEALRLGYRISRFNCDLAIVSPLAAAL